MKLRRLDVDGFGTLSGFTIEELSPRLTVISGPNEAGKSTLLDFVRFVLFGFPRERSISKHEPLRGGRHGGSLRVLDDEGREWTIERHADRRGALVTGPNGETGGEEELRALLGGADANVFRTVFAFGLSELISLENLESDEVRDLIFTAGVLGAGRSATQAVRQLGDRQSELLKPRARARANDLARRLEDTRRQLRAKRAEASGYAASAARLRELAKQTSAASEREDALTARRAELDELLAAGPAWNRLRDAETRLRELDDPPESDYELRERTAEIRSLVEDRSGHLERLEKLGTLRRQRDGIDNGVRELAEERARRADRLDEFAPRARPDAEIRADQHRLRSIRSLVQQRDQFLTIRAQHDAMLIAAEAAKRPGVSEGMVVGLVLAAALAVVGGVVGVVRHQSVTAALAFVAALAVVVVIVVARRAGRREARGAPELDDAHRPPASVDVDRLSEEIARFSSAVGLAKAPLLSEIESLSLGLDEELALRERLDKEAEAIAKLDVELSDLEERRLAVDDALRGERSRIEEFDDRTRSAALACDIDDDAPSSATCLRLSSALEASERRAAERRSIEDELTKARASLVETIGSGNKAERFELLLAEGDRPAWEAERVRTISAIEEARAIWRKIRDDEAAAARELAELENSAEIARLEIESAPLCGELRDALREWLTLGIARELLRETMDHYERERQPAVIAKASELFALVTDGRYERLVAREDERGSGRAVVAMTKNGSSVDAASLSRGTQEQLYLCLRFGLASVHAERSVALPFVLDDVLVNFDPERSTAVAEVIAETAASHQVIAFTCHPHVVETLAEAAPGCRIVEIPA